MSRRNQTIALGVLLAILGVTVYSRFRTSDDNAKTFSATGLFTPINVDNPALRLDVLQHFLSLQYKGSHRNIFVATLPPPPPPPNVEAKYFGFVSDSRGSYRRAFFATSNNEEVFVAGEGDTLLGRFRVVKLTSTSADLEEVSSGRHATLTLEEAVPNG